ncbi:MAG: TVP38/TMEM64 family protein [Candidatus Eremiobacteraeota bacterium]|nr:TVP38/TMEM64 family protein [Candidatus Eremiobacteraeota bacterium]
MNRLVRRLGGIGLLALSFTLAYAVIRWQPQVEHEIRTLGVLAYPLAIAIFALVASAPFSVTDALAVMNGAIFGPVVGSLVNAIGLVLAAMLGYWVNLRASHLLDLHAYLQKLPAWVKRFPVGSPAFLIAVRVIPGFGGTVATASAAAFKVPMWVHVWTMCAIAVPICTVLAIFGDRVTVFIHQTEFNARHYCETHRCPRIFHRREDQETPKP